MLSSGFINGGVIGGLVASFGRAFAGGEAKLGIGAKSFIASGEWANVIRLIIFGGLVGLLITIARRLSEGSQRFRALRSGGFRSTKLSTCTELE